MALVLAPGSGLSSLALVLAMYPEMKPVYGDIWAQAKDLDPPRRNSSRDGRMLPPEECRRGQQRARGAACAQQASVRRGRRAGGADAKRVQEETQQDGPGPAAEAGVGPQRRAAGASPVRPAVSSPSVLTRGPGRVRSPRAEEASSRQYEGPGGGGSPREARRCPLRGASLSLEPPKACPRWTTPAASTRAPRGTAQSPSWDVMTTSRAHGADGSEPSLTSRWLMDHPAGPGPPYSSLWATSELEPLADEGKLEVVESDQSWLRSSSWGSQRLDPSSLSVAGRSQPRRWRLTQPPVSRSRSPNARWPPPDQPGLFWPVISELRRQAASAQGLVMTVETAELGSPLSRPREPRPRGTVAVQLFAESLLAATAPKPRGASSRARKTA